MFENHILKCFLLFISCFNHHQNLSNLVSILISNSITLTHLTKPVSFPTNEKQQQKCCGECQFTCLVNFNCTKFSFYSIQNEKFRLKSHAKQKVQIVLNHDLGNNVRKRATLHCVLQQRETSMK